MIAVKKRSIRKSAGYAVKYFSLDFQSAFKTLNIKSIGTIYNSCLETTLMLVYKYIKQ